MESGDPAAAAGLLLLDLVEQQQARYIDAMNDPHFHSDFILRGSQIRRPQKKERQMSTSRADLQYRLCGQREGGWVQKVPKLCGRHIWKPLIARYFTKTVNKIALF